MRLAEATVLIADDEAELLAIFEKWFKREGCHVLVACNGAVALELAERNHVDLIISDIRMPVMDGIEMVKRVAASLCYLPKLLLVSGFSDTDVRELYDLGIESTIQKPMRRQELVETARRSLMEKRTRWGEASFIVPRNAIITRLRGLHEALQDGLIAFGYGGFCMPSELVVAVDEPVGLGIEFHEDRRAVIGQGVVRWTEAKLIGVEIVYVEEPKRDWVIELTGREVLRSFIPRSCVADQAQPAPL